MCFFNEKLRIHLNSNLLAGFMWQIYWTASYYFCQKLTLRYNTIHYVTLFLDYCIYATSKKVCEKFLCKHTFWMNYIQILFNFVQILWLAVWFPPPKKKCFCQMNHHLTQTERHSLNEEKKKHFALLLTLQAFRPIWCLATIAKSQPAGHR